MREQLTERRALEICRDMWRWIEQTPMQDKCDYAESHPEIMDCENFCPCCEFVCQRNPSERHGMSCGDTDPKKNTPPSQTGCPLAAIWPEGCCVAGSPYDAWNMRHPEHAKAIADACEARLTELDEQEKGQA